MMSPSEESGTRELPYPPFELANRVCSLERFEDARGGYDQLGREAREAIVRLLPDGWSFHGKRVLDFGCGAGRTLRQFIIEASDAEFFGADIDEASIAWLQSHLSPPFHCLRNPAAPPLGLPHGSLDLAWALSVFTHLTDNSLPWLVELHKLLKPDGLLIATYMGRWNGAIYTGEEWDEDRVGMNVLRADQSWDQGGPVVLMSDWWVREHWGRAFEFVAVEPNVHGQTWVLLRKRDVEVDVEDLGRPADDPREIEALRHNLRQLERDAAGRIAVLRAEYESSLSWRLTRPLRDGARYVVSIARSRRGR